MALISTGESMQRRPGGTSVRPKVPGPDVSVSVNTSKPTQSTLGHKEISINSTNKQAKAANNGSENPIKSSSSALNPNANISVKLGGRTIVVDENLSPKIATELQTMGYNVKTFAKGTLDADIITYADKANAIVLTNNLRDFNKWGITTFKVSENMKLSTEVRNVVKAVENVNIKATSNPAIIEKGKNVSLAENK